jgi:hypothetical protein
LRRSQEIGVALLLVGFGFRAGAQSFNLRVDPFGQEYGETAFSVEVANDSNYVVIASVPFNDGQFFYSAVVTSMVVNQLGLVLSTENVWYPPHATYPGWSNSTDKRTDGGFVVGGNTLRADTAGNLIRRAALFMVAPDGSMEGLHEVGPDNQSWIGRQAKQTPDGGYVICGETSAVGNALQAFVIKTDAQGNEEWTQTYGGQWNDFAMAIDRHEGTNYLHGWPTSSLLATSNSGCNASMTRVALRGARSGAAHSANPTRTLHLLLMVIHW